MSFIPYITPGANQDITGRVTTNDAQGYVTPIVVSTSTLALNVNAVHKSVFRLDITEPHLPSACTITANVGGNLIDGASLDILIPSDLTSPGSTITFTFSTGFKMPSNTLAITAGKYGIAKFTYVGDNSASANGYWVGSSTLSAS